MTPSEAALFIQKFLSDSEEYRHSPQHPRSGKSPEEKLAFARARREKADSLTKRSGPVGVLLRAVGVTAPSLTPDMSWEEFFRVRDLLLRGIGLYEHMREPEPEAAPPPARPPEPTPSPKPPRAPLKERIENDPIRWLGAALELGFGAGLGAGLYIHKVIEDVAARQVARPASTAPQAPRQP